MKHLLSFIIIINFFGITEIVALNRIKKPKPAVMVQENEESNEEDDEDEKVVLANFANMAASMAQFNNPATVGPALISFFMSIVNIALQVCKDMPIRTEITPEQILLWFNNLSPEAQQEIVKILQG